MSEEEIKRKKHKYDDYEREWSYRDLPISRSRNFGHRERYEYPSFFQNKWEKRGGRESERLWDDDYYRTPRYQSPPDYPMYRGGMRNSWMNEEPGYYGPYAGYNGPYDFPCNCQYCTYTPPMPMMYPPPPSLYYPPPIPPPPQVTGGCMRCGSGYYGPGNMYGSGYFPGPPNPMRNSGYYL